MGGAGSRTPRHPYPPGPPGNLHKSRQPAYWTDQLAKCQEWRKGSHGNDPEATHRQITPARSAWTTAWVRLRRLRRVTTSWTTLFTVRSE
ncbi:hypothetical protein GCM10009738_84200 [Kitasatospora viridis]